MKSLKTTPVEPAYFGQKKGKQCPSLPSAGIIPAKNLGNWFSLPTLVPITPGWGGHLGHIF